MSGQHSPKCRYEETGWPCIEFSTDGSLAGARIAHHFGTTDEEEIKATNRIGTIEDNARALTGMTEEQAEWEGGNDSAEAGDEEGFIELPVGFLWHRESREH
jgi:hypothetical protein